MASRLAGLSGQSPSSGPSASAMSGGPAAMSGNADMAQPSDTGVDTSSDDGQQQMIMQIRSMQDTVKSLAQQYPAASEAARQADSGLKAMLRQIVANPGGPEPDSPESL